MPKDAFKKTMYFFQVVFATLLACAAAAPGLIGSPYGYAAPLASPWGHGLVSAPIVKTVAPVATSYANTVRVCQIHNYSLLKQQRTTVITAYFSWVSSAVTTVTQCSPSQHHCCQSFDPRRNFLCQQICINYIFKHYIL